MIDRRRFLQSMGAAAAMAAAPRFCAAGQSHGADWRLGWKSMDQDSLAPQTLKIQGKLPDALRGVLFRNGPARHERGGVRYRHWFDGDGMIQRFEVGDGRIVHNAQFVQTRKYQAESAAGRFLYSAAGTALPNAEPSAHNDTGNVANISVLPWDDELLALWEGGSAYRLNPDTLATIGRKDWRDDLVHMPFSAHPEVDRDGTLWNFGSAPYAGRNGLLFIYRIEPKVGVRAVERIALPVASYLHSFAMSERYLMFHLGAHHYEPGGDTFVDAFQWQPERGSQILVIDKNDLSKQRYFEAPAAFTFHTANAYEHGDDLVLQLCLYKDAGIMDSAMVGLMDGGDTVPYPQFERSYMASIRMNLKTGVASTETSDTIMEFPSEDVRASGAEADVFGVSHKAARTLTYSNALVRWRPDGREAARYDFPADQMVEEPLLVAQKDQSFLIGTFLDLAARQSGVYVFDADRLDAGPLATARMPRTIPLGFHGTFVPG
ncbi:MAG: carotenoid oxygenase family protein [Pseudomonadota bacterium]